MVYKAGAVLWVPNIVPFLDDRIASYRHIGPAAVLGTSVRVDTDLSRPHDLPFVFRAPQPLHALCFQRPHGNSTLLVQLVIGITRCSRPGVVENTAVHVASVAVFAVIGVSAAGSGRCNSHAETLLEPTDDALVLENLGQARHADDEEAARSFCQHPEDNRGELVHLVQIISISDGNADTESGRNTSPGEADVSFISQHSEQKIGKTYKIPRPKTTLTPSFFCQLRFKFQIVFWGSTSMTTSLNS